MNQDVCEDHNLAPIQLLTVDILYNIFALTDWKTIRALSCTCRILRDVVMTHFLFLRSMILYSINPQISGRPDVNLCTWDEKNHTLFYSIGTSMMEQSWNGRAVYYSPMSSTYYMGALLQEEKTYIWRWYSEQRETVLCAMDKTNDSVHTIATLPSKMLYQDPVTGKLYGQNQKRTNLGTHPTLDLYDEKYLSKGTFSPLASPFDAFIIITKAHQTYVLGWARIDPTSEERRLYQFLWVERDSEAIMLLERTWNGSLFDNSKEINLTYDGWRDELWVYNRRACFVVSLSSPEPSVHRAPQIEGLKGKNYSLFFPKEESRSFYALSCHVGDNKKYVIQLMKIANPMKCIITPQTLK